MKILRDIASWRYYRQSLSSSQTLGFVPTMGCLHRGHEALLKQSIADNDVTVLSIFVNPTQFNDPTDYTQYPRTEQEDLALAKKIGIDCVFMPTEEAMYPDHGHYTISTTHPFSQVMEGLMRPGHFTGVLTVVTKLLLLVNPHKAYFGEKDYQQLQLVRGLVEAFFMNTEIIACPTVREPSGLPCSSRNRHLSQAEKQLAEQFAHMMQNYHHPADMKKKLTHANLHADYVEQHEKRLFAAVRVGKTRLIDNVPQ